jgi:hypothetical protein
MTLKDHIKLMIEGGNLLDQAIAWHLRLAEADEAGWLAQTDSALAQAEAELSTNLVSLFLALGGGWQT